MTWKDYRAIAIVYNRVLNKLDTYQTRRQIFNILVECLIDVFKHNNRHFDHGKFYDAIYSVKSDWQRLT